MSPMNAGRAGRSGHGRVLGQGWLDAPRPGAEIVARIVDRALDHRDGPVERFGAQATPVPYSPTLEAEMLPTHVRIAEPLAAVGVA
jgi:pyruvate/2-oxoglutarate/acetoin dehydrogenase E1 component